MFEPSPKARADLNGGTLYALMGEGGWIYYGQVTPAPLRRVGFFCRRDRDVVDIQSILSSPIMAVIAVNIPSITRALRAGEWKKLGRYELAAPLRATWSMVN